MKKLIGLLFLVNSYAQAQNYQASPLLPVFENLGFEVDVLGPIFGQYGFGVNSFLSPFVQIGINTTYFDTQYVSPEKQGWQAEFRTNYLFSSRYRSGFYLGAAIGAEAVSVKDAPNSNWVRYNDLTWAGIPGYAWVASQSITVNLGLRYGYGTGENQITPEIKFNILF